MNKTNLIFSICIAIALLACIGVSFRLHIEKLSHQDHRRTYRVPVAYTLVGWKTIEARNWSEACNIVIKNNCQPIRETVRLQMIAILLIQQ